MIVAKHLLQHQLVSVHQLSLKMTFQAHCFCKSCRRKVWIQALMIVWMQVLQVDADIVAKHDDGDYVLSDAQMVAGAMPSATVAVGEQHGETFGDAIEVPERGDEADDDLLNDDQHVAGHMPSTCSAKTTQNHKKANKQKASGKEAMTTQAKKQKKDNAPSIEKTSKPACAYDWSDEQILATRIVSARTGNIRIYLLGKTISSDIFRLVAENPAKVNVDHRAIIEQVLVFVLIMFVFDCNCILC